LSEYDKEMASTLQSKLNIKLTDDAWEQATLPVANGGIGIHKATQVSLPAFLSSLAGTEPLVSELIPGCLHQVAGTNDDPQLKAVLGEWCTRVDSIRQSSLRTAQLRSVGTIRWWKSRKRRCCQLHALDQAGKARLIAAAASHSGAFLHARPYSALGTRFDNSSLRIAVALRLGAPVCAPHVCVCVVSVDIIIVSVAAGLPVDCHATAYSQRSDQTRPDFSSSSLPIRAALAFTRRQQASIWIDRVALVVWPMSGVRLYVSTHTGTEPHWLGCFWTRSRGLRSCRP